MPDSNAARSLSLPLSYERGSVKSLEETVSELFHSMRGGVYRYLLAVLENAAEAEDVTQESFLRLYRHLRDGHSVYEPRPWVFRVAHNLALNRKKAERFVRSFEPPDWAQIVRARAASLTPEQDLLQRERYEAVRVAVRGLTEQQRQVLGLRAQGLGYREIAEILSLSVPAVAAHVRRGIAKIKAEING